MKFSIQTAVTVIIGLLFLASLTAVYFALSEGQALPLTLVALANISAVILLTFLITRGIMQPLKHIRGIMRQVAKGNLARHIDLKATKEMEEISEAFNDMISKLQSAKQGVEDTNKLLERRVEKRTQQLSELAASLEEKVGARTKELQEKVEELERFQKLAVGRELRMIELKESMQKFEGKKNKQGERSPDSNYDKKKKKSL